MVRKIVKEIKSNEPSGAYFDNAHIAVSYSASKRLAKVISLKARK